VYVTRPIAHVVEDDPLSDDDDDESAGGSPDDDDESAGGSPEDDDESAGGSPDDDDEPDAPDEPEDDASADPLLESSPVPPGARQMLDVHTSPGMHAPLEEHGHVSSPIGHSGIASPVPSPESGAAEPQARPSARPRPSRPSRPRWIGDARIRPEPTPRRAAW
jgi:hypothetical protein